MTHDLVVLGGGTAGLVAALGSAALGAHVALVERDRLGGDCLWTGCVPSKSLLAAAAAAQRARDAGRFGIEAEPVVDFQSVMRHVHAVIATIEPHDSADRLRREGVTVVEGHARFSGANRIVVQTAGGTTELRYRRAVIATGSSPALPPVPGLADVDSLTSDTVWDVTDLPARLVVFGGGPIGCELGQAFARLGSRVTVLEVAPRLLPRDHPDAARIVRDRLAADGVDVRTGASVASVSCSDGAIEVRCQDGPPIRADRVLVAAGRAPRTSDLGLERVGVELTERGHVRVNDHLATTARSIFAAGDVTGAPAFTHVAAYHGGLIVQNATLGLRRKARYAAIPAVTYTDPEVAQVGDLPTGAGDGARTVRVEHAALDRAIAEADTAGFTELVADRRGRLIGATVVGPAAGEAIDELTYHVRAGTRLRTLAGVVHAYPTRSEAIQRAALDDLRMSLGRYAGPLRAYLAVRRRLVR